MSVTFVMALQMLQSAFALAVELGVPREKVLHLVGIYWPIDEEAGRDP